MSSNDIKIDIPSDNVFDLYSCQKLLIIPSLVLKNDEIKYTDRIDIKTIIELLKDKNLKVQRHSMEIENNWLMDYNNKNGFILFNKDFIIRLVCCNNNIRLVKWVALQKILKLNQHLFMSSVCLFN